MNDAEQLKALLSGAGIENDAMRFRALAAAHADRTSRYALCEVYYAQQWYPVDRTLQEIADELRLTK